MPLLENLCKVNKQQGGTIHQFINLRDWRYQQLMKMYYEYTKCGLEFNSKKAFDKLANQYHVKINWKNKPGFFEHAIEDYTEFNKHDVAKFAEGY